MVEALVSDSMQCVVGEEGIYMQYFLSALPF